VWKIRNRLWEEECMGIGNGVSGIGNGVYGKSGYPRGKGMHGNYETSITLANNRLLERS
jgi:hypothetical protein